MGLPLKGPLATKLWLVSKAFHKLPFDLDILGLSIARLDWIVQMLAQDDPDNIQVLRNGEPERTPEQIKTLSLVGAWDQMRGSAKQEFLKAKIPVALRDAMQKRKKLQEGQLSARN